MTIQTPVTGKPATSSLTMWLNFATLAFVVAAVTLPEVSALIPANFQPYIVAIVAVANLALRYFRTSAPITSILPPA